MTGDARTVKRGFNHAATWHPETEFLVQAFEPDRRLTFRRANEEARRIAGALAGLGVEKGDRVAFLSPATVEHAVAYFAASKLGAIPTTLHHREGSETLGTMIETVTPSVLVFHPSFSETVAALAEETSAVESWLVFDELGEGPAFATPLSSLCREASATEPAVEVTPDDPAFVNFTSGTTGTPDAVVHTHAELVECVHNGYLYGLGRDDVFLNSFAPEFIGWQNRVVTAGLLGATVVLQEGWDPRATLRAIAQEGVTTLKLIPSQWKRLFEEDLDAVDLGSVRMVGYAGEPIGPALLERIRERFADDVRATYGTTEAMRVMALFPQAMEGETLASVGKPLPHAEVRIVEPGSFDPTAAVPKGDVGELLVRGPTVAERIWDDPERTRELFHPEGWWYSGDLARQDEAGNVYIEGRRDNMIISGGINIYPERVEQVIERHPAVVECAVVGVPDEEWNQALQARVVAAEPVTESELAGWCAAQDLESHRHPKGYVFVDDLPRTNSGKVDRSRLQPSRD